MPKYQPTTIAFQESGLVRDKQAFVPPTDAYVDLDNAYVWRGVVKRRLAPEFLARLRRCPTSQSLGNAPGSGTTYTANIKTLLLYGTNSNIEPGSVEITVGGLITVEDDGAGGFTQTAGTATLDTALSSINYYTMVFTIELSAGAFGTEAVTIDLCYFPTEPCMGIAQRELSAINAEDTIFFDTRHAFIFSTSSFTELGSTTPTSWTGGDSDFFWHTNYWFDGSQNKLFWVTNGFMGSDVATTDPIRYYNGSTWNPVAFLPKLKSAGTDIMVTAKIIIPYRGRLVALNTYEAVNSTGTTVPLQFPNRARFSQNGDPTDIAASPSGGWVDDVQGRGGFVDAPTNENIISAGFIRDVLVVFFEKSSWKLRYTGNEILPFVWERINIELGAESRFSIVRFDEGIVAVGDKGIISCDGNNVRRIDDPIRDEVFKIHNGNNGVKRVQGIRNFFEQVVYWTFPSASENPTYPNRILLYNYDNNTWAFFNDHFTALGNFQRTNDVRWSDLAGITWQEYKHQWNAGRTQIQFPLIVGGNQQGYVSILNSLVSNEKSLVITGIATGTPPVVTSPNHNLEDGEIIEINGIVGTSNIFNGYRFQVNNKTVNTFELQQKTRTTITSITKGVTTSVTSAGNILQVGDLVQFSAVTGATQFNNRTATVLTNGNTFTCDLDSSNFVGVPAAGEAENLESIFEDSILAGGSTYTVGGEITRITGFSIRSKKFNMLNQGRKSQLGYIDFLVDKTSSGQVDVPIFADYNNDERINPKGGDTFFNWGIGTTILPEDASMRNENKVWHRLYCPLEAQFFQYDITLSEAQLISTEIHNSEFLLNAIIVWHEKGGRLVR